LANEKILIVDDNPTNLKLELVLLKKNGYDVYSAEDAETALAMLETLRPQMILMDIQLPGMDGLQLTRKLKSDPLSKDVIIIAVTSYAMKGDQKRAIDAGCDFYISKPINVTEFPKIIAKFLAG